MDEILEEFCNDTTSILQELIPILEELEADPNQFKSLEAYGQKVDRIMGAAKSIGLNDLGTITDFCKSISYKGAQSKNIELVKIIVAFLFEATEAIDEMNNNLRSQGQENLSELAKEILISRLNYISSKLSEIQRSSVAIDDPELLKLVDNYKLVGKK